MADRCPYCGGELVTSWDPIPPEDGEDEELAGLYAAGVEHAACSRCRFVGVTPDQAHKLQMRLARVEVEPLAAREGERSGVDGLFAAGVGHQVCPTCGFVTFTEEQADEVHRAYWRDRRRRDG